MNRRERLLKRLSRAIDRAIAARLMTHMDAWCQRWANAYKRECEKQYKQFI